tara:strand:- start:2001 stop:3638 length:1638 start_codon:yes stop_codon:yes gene_type:complete
MNNLEIPSRLIRLYEDRTSSEYCSETTLDDFNAVVCSELAVPYCTVLESSIDENFLNENYRLTQHNNFVPIFSFDVSLVIVTTKPWDENNLKEIRRALNVELYIVCVSESNFTRLQTRCYRVHELYNSNINAQKKQALHLSPVQNWDFNQRKPVDFAHNVLIHAYRSRASDIHVSLTPDRLVIRYRINGEMTAQAPVGGTSTSRDAFRALQVFAEIPTNSKVSCFSSCEIPIDKKLIRYRGVFLPTSHGGSLVFRVLDDSIWATEEGRRLPFEGDDLKAVETNLARPNGLILVVGPTGSGKSTTLCKCIMHLKPELRSVKTIENPVEYVLPNVDHMGVVRGETSEESLTMYDGLVAHLRADPDVILVGEIQEKETARAAITGAMTGHLLLSTLHTMDCISTIERLIDLGIEPFYLDAVMSLVIAQRLVPQLCPSCKVEVVKTNAIKDAFAAHQLQLPDKIYESEGCPECGETGSIGRIAVFEILDFTGPLSNFIQRGNSSQLRQEWLKSGGITLYERGLKLVADGNISFKSAQSLQGKNPKKDNY